IPDPKLPLRTTSPIVGETIHAAALNRQQRPDRWQQPHKNRPFLDFRKVNKTLHPLAASEKMQRQRRCLRQPRH
ncbi:MAG: hypothetical protein ACK5PU_03295, partial [bacterium]